MCVPHYNHCGISMEQWINRGFREVLCHLSESNIQHQIIPCNATGTSILKTSDGTHANIRQQKTSIALGWLLTITVKSQVMITTRVSNQWYNDCLSNNLLSLTIQKKNIKMILCLCDWSLTNGFPLLRLRTCKVSGSWRYNVVIWATPRSWSQYLRVTLKSFSDRLKHMALEILR